MYLVYDTQTKRPDRDRNGHVKVYVNEKAARRAAQRFNNSVAPAYPGEKFKRMAVVSVNLQLDKAYGQVNYREV